jgi:hypothetical protein
MSTIGTVNSSALAYNYAVARKPEVSEAGQRVEAVKDNDADDRAQLAAKPAPSTNAYGETVGKVLDVSA